MTSWKLGSQEENLLDTTLGALGIRINPLSKSFDCYEIQLNIYGFVSCCRKYAKCSTGG